MDAESFRRLISGEQRGLLPAFMRGGLRVLSWGYGIGARSRNLAFDLGWKQTHRVEVPVISLGNLTAGGTGKTPFAAFTARWFRQYEIRVCLISRGYHAAPGEVNDEALVLDQLCPDVPHLQNPDRVAAARTAIEELESQLLILDDGFQHRRLARDLDVVLIDALNPWGYGSLLPRGLLREPGSSLRRAGLVVITRANQSTPTALQSLRTQIARLRGEAGCVEASFPPEKLINSQGETADWSYYHGGRIGAFCGIGNPAAFRKTITRDLGIKIEPEAFREFPDHHRYTREDVEDLARWTSRNAFGAVFTTQKDLVKLAIPDLGGIPLWAVEIGVRIEAGNDLLENAYRRIRKSIQP